MVSTEVGLLIAKAQGADIRIEGWSPDGTWLGYWHFTEEDWENDSYPAPIGKLNFLNNQTGAICEHLDVISSDHGLEIRFGPRIIWQPDGRAAVFGFEEDWIGPPCGKFMPAQASEIVLPKQPDPSLSPNGGYYVRTDLREETDAFVKVTTTLFEVSTDEVMNQVDWEIDRRLGELGLGGEWVSEGMFLIYETWEQGPLLIRVGEGIVEIAPDLFGIPGTISAEVGLQAYAAAVDGTDIYHILLFGRGLEADFPPVRLYHSETGQVEELPYPHLWHRGFSPDGRWVFLDSRPDQSGYESYALWIRPVDPSGSEFRLFAKGTTLAAWSPDETQIAFGWIGKFSILIFPEGEVLGSWNTGRYANNQLIWSPNGDFIATAGNIPGKFDAALFVVPVP